MTTFQQYVKDLAHSFENDMKQVPGEWIISEGLEAKVTADGRMNDFFGATTVIRLGEQDLTRCVGIQEELFRRHPEALVRIEPSTFHLTIHALSNVYSVSADEAAIRADIRRLEPMLEAAFRGIGERYGDRLIAMRCFGASTAGKDVVSLKFYPASAGDYETLISLFDRIETIFPLGRRFVPHVSLGYFRLRSYGREEIDALYETLQSLNDRGAFEIRLPVRDFVYQHHYSMNDFRDVFAVRDFIS